MCNQHRLKTAVTEIADMFRDLEAPVSYPEGAPNVPPREVIAITDSGPIIRPGTEGLELVQRPWSWKGPTGAPVFNFRSDGRRFARGSRCAIPTDGFYEFTAPEDPRQKKKDRWLFTMKGEEALCRLLSDEPQQVRIAVSLYRAIARDFSTYPAVWFRLGQACARASVEAAPGSKEAEAAADEAFDAYDAASRMLVSLPTMPPEERILLISPGQEEYIHDNLGRLQGFIRWRNSDRRQKVKELSMRDLSDLIDAYRVTEAAFKASRTEEKTLKLANNAAYYAVEALRVSRLLGKRPAGLPVTASLKELLAALENPPPFAASAR
jgi:hypothetical protein